MNRKRNGRRMGVFDCPHCGVYERHRWARFFSPEGEDELSLETSRCCGCSGLAVWLDGLLLFPQKLPETPVRLPAGTRAVALEES